jgi:hypothetical protein
MDVLSHLSWALAESRRAPKALFQPQTGWFWQACNCVRLEAAASAPRDAAAEQGSSPLRNARIA